VLASAAHFAKLPEEVHAGLLACGESTRDFVYDHAAKLETELLTVIKDAGVTVNEADKDAFIAASAPIYEEFAGSVEGGQDLIDRIQSLSGGS